MAKSKTSFSNKKQPAKRQNRGKTERTKILEAMKRAGKTENEFYDLLVERATDAEDNFTFKELLVRMSPIPKAVAPLVKFEFPKKDKPHVQAAYVLDAVSKGIIPSDIGNTFIQSIKAMIDIEEFTNLKERIEKIEGSLGLSNE